MKELLRYPYAAYARPETVPTRPRAVKPKPRSIKRGSWLRSDALVHLRDALVVLLRRMVALGLLSCEPSEDRRTRRIPPEGVHLRREIVDVTSGYRDTRFTVEHELREPAHLRRDDGFPARERLQCNETEYLV